MGNHAPQAPGPGDGNPAPGSAPASAAAPALADGLVQKVAMLLVLGGTREAAYRACVDRFGCGTDEATRVLAEARRRITIAADHHRDEEVGTAYHRLNDLYARALKADDPRTALAAQKELNRLMGLYDAPAGIPQTTEADDTLALIRAHLVPLRLAPDGHPLEEHARIAAEQIRRGRGQEAASQTGQRQAGETRRG